MKYKNIKTISITANEQEYLLQGLLLAEAQAEKLANVTMAAQRCAEIANLREKILETELDMEF